MSTPTSPVSPSTRIHIQRAMSFTEAWRPVVNRRNSYKKEDLKHELQMALICDIKTGPGFSEKM
ncbi:hypothetical protein CPLU01_14522 [Colletotrichum plurivorum]|uniref:Uncharacterized protein n=1 Tax=Colletotrichum plurivorum TaxID=2175906 RepID=A0A8H6JIQ0_9PEZI|nr:hypothetical protein CPLU01_14522 [Colletotrichum plurivorum]